MQNAATGKFAKRHIIETFYKISGATEYLPAVIPILPQEVCAPVVKFLGISNRQGIPFELSGHRRLRPYNGVNSKTKRANGSILQV